jgi:hypothetical protein
MARKKICKFLSRNQLQLKSLALNDEVFFQSFSFLPDSTRTVAFEHEKNNFVFVQFLLLHYRYTTDTVQVTITSFTRDYKRKDVKLQMNTRIKKETKTRMFIVVCYMSILLHQSQPVHRTCSRQIQPRNTLSIA